MGEVKASPAYTVLCKPDSAPQHLGAFTCSGCRRAGKLPENLMTYARIFLILRISLFHKESVCRVNLFCSLIVNSSSAFLFSLVNPLPSTSKPELLVVWLLYFFFCLSLIFGYFLNDLKYISVRICLISFVNTMHELG